MTGADLHTSARALMEAALSAADPAAAVSRHVRREGDTLIVGQRGYSLDQYERVFVLAAGKAALAMANATADVPILPQLAAPRNIGPVTLTS